MDAHETDAPAWSRPHHDDDATAQDEANAPTAGETANDEVIVIESHETGYADSDVPAETDADQQADAPAASAWTIWSAGTSGPAEPAMTEDELAAEDELGAEDGLAAEDELAAADVDDAAPVMAPSEPVVTPAVASETNGDAQQWSEIKAMFVDDPGESVKLASGLVQRAIENLTASLRQRQDSLASWESGDAAGTEELRNALRGYQSLFDELDGMSRQFGPGHDKVSDG